MSETTPTDLRLSGGTTDLRASDTPGVLVVGLGSAGEATARQLARAGWRVVGFEPGRVGGECPFVACMPSKALLHRATTHHDATERAWTDAIAFRDAVVDHLDDSEHADGLRGEGVEIVRRAAIIEATDAPGRPWCVRDETGHRWVADELVVATGSAPRVPDIAGIERERIWTSVEALTADELPQSAIVLGGGAIGLELATIAAGFDRSVTVVEPSERLHPGGSATVADIHHRLLDDRGIVVELGVEPTAVRHRDDGFELDLDDGRTLEADRLIVATGTVPRRSEVGLDRLGLDVDAVEPDGSLGGAPGLHVLGDVNGQRPWTHGANLEARRCVAGLLGRAVTGDPGPTPHAIFTDPPYAAVGPNLDAALADGVDAVEVTARYGDVARTTTDELDDGALTLVIDRSTGRVLGGSGVGERMDDLIAIVTAHVHGGQSVARLRDQPVAFPTLAQVIEVAIDRAADRLDVRD